MARATVVEKKSCARQACEMLTGGGRSSNTVSPKNALENHRSQSDEAELTHPRAGLDTPKPDCQHDGEHPYRGRHHTMAMLEEDSAGHFGHHLTVGKRPVGNRETGFFAGHGCHGDYQKERCYRQENRKAV
jgi:hypothetical protein